MYNTLSRILSAIIFPFTNEFWKIYGISFIISSFILIFLWYYLVNKYNMEPNRMKCVFQYISSGIMSLVCWPIVLDLWIKYFDFKMDINLWLNYESYKYSNFLLNMFLSSLIFDLIFGVIYFRKNMFILNGWFHHSAYILFTLYIMKWKAFNIFLLAIPEEIPTYFISLYVIFPYNNKNFSRTMFCITFFIFRIAYHISGYCLLFISNKNRETTQLWIPTSLTIFAHCYWYLLWLRKHWKNLFYYNNLINKDDLNNDNLNNNEYRYYDMIDNYDKIERNII